jgi:hypothetical protein
MYKFIDTIINIIILLRYIKREFGKYKEHKIIIKDGETITHTVQY